MSETTRGTRMDIVKEELLNVFYEKIHFADIAGEDGKKYMGRKIKQVIFKEDMEELFDDVMDWHKRQLGKEWISVKDKLSIFGKGSFLAWWENQPTVMLVCRCDIHKNYHMCGTDDTCGFGEHPKFSHWMPLPDRPRKEQ